MIKKRIDSPSQFTNNAGATDQCICKVDSAGIQRRKISIQDERVPTPCNMVDKGSVGVGGGAGAKEAICSEAFNQDILIKEMDS